MTTHTETPSAEQPLLRPVAAQERVLTLDILRGFALFGVMAVNIGLFSGLVTLSSFYLAPPGTLDWAAAWFTSFFATGKFYSLFSLLFGLGLVIQMERAMAKGQAFGAFYRQRLFFLFLIGLVHGLLLWQGDILMVYAILGGLLFLFRNSRPRTLMIWIGVLLAIPVIGNGLFGVSALVLSMTPGGQEMISGINAQIQSQSDFLATDPAAFREGGFLTVLAARAVQLAVIFPSQLIGGFPNIFAMFLLGMYFGKRGLLTNSAAQQPFFRRLLIGGLLIGVPINIFYATVYNSINPVAFDPTAYAAHALHTIGSPALMLSYLAAIVLLVERGGMAARALAALAPLGQTALSNYIGQSVVMNLIFFSYGLAFMPALYGQTDAAINLGIVVAVYIAQIIISSLWVRRFRFGPLEWLWRSLAYGALQPFARRTEAAAVRGAMRSDL